MNEQDIPDFTGITRRDYFAAMAMQGILASPLTDDTCTTSELVGHAVFIADALIAELDKK